MSFINNTSWPFNKLLSSSLLILLVTLLLSACGGVSKSSKRPDNFGEQKKQIDAIKHSGTKVALLLPLSTPGEPGRTAKQLKQAGQLALFENPSSNIILFTKDTKGNASAAREAVSSAMNEGAKAIIGPLFAGAVKAIAPSARARNVPVIAFSTNKSVAGNGVNLLSFLPEAEVGRVVNYSIRSGKKNIVAFLPRSPYGSIVEKALLRTAQRSGGRVVHIEKYSRGANSINAASKKLSEWMATSGANVDAVMLAQGGGDLDVVLTSLANADITSDKVQFLGTGLWANSSSQTLPQLKGAWYASADPSSRRNFESKFLNAYGRKPSQIASLAYDAVGLIIAISKSAGDGSISSANIKSSDGFVGVDGIFRFNSQGLAERGLAIMEIGSGSMRVISSAPSGFGYLNTGM